MVRLRSGSSPLAPVKVASVVNKPVDLTISNTVRSSSAPPSSVVPKRSPSASMVRLPAGFAPLAPVKVASVINAPVDLTISNTVPSLGAAADFSRPNKIACRVADDGPKRKSTVGASEGRQRRQFASGLGDLEHRAVAVRPVKGCRPEQIARRVAGDRPKRICTVGASEP